MNKMHKIAEVGAPTVAVIVPFYNGAKWIERAIKSVINQTTPPDEFFIVNDGSTPQEREALAALAKDYPFTIIDKKNGGQGSARNAGVRAATSEFISFLDQDDFYFPDHIRDLVEALPERDCRLGFVYANLCGADEDGNIFHSNLLDDIPSRNPKRGRITSLLRNDLYILPSASLIKKSAFEKIDGFDEQFTGYEDDDLFLRMFRAGFTNYYLDKSVTVWCQHTGSTSYSIKMARSRWKYFMKLSETFLDAPHHHGFSFRDCLLPRFAPLFMMDAYKAVLSQSADREELVNMLVDFSKVVSANASVGRPYKVRLRLFAWALQHPYRPVMFTLRSMFTIRYRVLGPVARLLGLRRKHRTA